VKYHLLGIGGVGMSALARLLVHLGHEVTGCDVAPGPYAARLLAQGVPVQTGHDPAHAALAEVFVHSAGVSADHPELSSARAAGRRVLGRLEGVAEALAGSRVIGVTGSHGKTTTTAMIASILTMAGLDPLVLLGGDLAGFEGNVRLGAGPWAVTEIDESDPTFAAVGVEIAVVTNLEDDHIADRAWQIQNYHPDLESLRNATRAFAAGARLCIHDSEWPGLAELLAGLPARTYGLGAGPEWTARDLALGPAGTTAAIHRAGELVARLTLSVPGRHNLRNALAALAATAEAGVDPAVATAALASFTGASRRWTRLGEPGGVLVIDDYAHHPTEVRATLDVASSLDRRIRVVFQPHRHGRFQQMWRRFADALQGVDEVIILPVFAAGEPPPETAVTPADLVRELDSRGVAAIHLPGQSEALEYLAASARRGDLVLTMGAGDVTDLGPRLVHRLASAPAAGAGRDPGGAW
jgi:UDP-N-acetylmuramate--alanine ligase